MSRPGELDSRVPEERAGRGIGSDGEDAIGRDAARVGHETDPGGTAQAIELSAATADASNQVVLPSSFFSSIAGLDSKQNRSSRK
jgi:hypothetical protein